MTFSFIIEVCDDRMPFDLREPEKAGTREQKRTASLSLTGSDSSVFIFFFRSFVFRLIF